MFFDSRSSQAKLIDLAYDQLTTTDKYERLDELFRCEMTTPSKKTGYTVDIPLKKLNRSVITEGHATSNLNVRLFLYLWSSERMVWTPPPSDSIQLYVDQSENDTLTKSDRVNTPKKSIFSGN